MRYLLIILAFSSLSVMGQRNLTDSTIGTFVFAPHYKFNITAGDLNKLWGYNNQVGGNIGWKFANNMYLGVDAGFIFGNKLKDTSIASNVYNSQGTITAWGGNHAQYLMLMRGASVHIDVGYVFSQLGPNPNSGLWINLGFGYFMHKIRIESLYDDIPQLEGDYRKGYDRLTMGFSTKQFVGYLFQWDKQRLLNFYVGCDFVQGWDRNVRNYNFDLGGPDNELKIDLMISPKIGWLIPIYKRTPKAFYTD